MPCWLITGQLNIHRVARNHGLRTSHEELQRRTAQSNLILTMFPAECTPVQVGRSCESGRGPTRSLATPERTPVGYIAMSFEELKSAVALLPREELERFSQWFEEFLAEQWDRRIEADILAGRLDAAGRRADEEFEAGRCTPLPP